MLGLHQFVRLRRLDGQPTRGARPLISPARLRAALRRAALLVISHGLNPLTIRLAGRQPRARLGIVEHRGRRSGRLYRTPVEARRAPDGGFLIPLTWGERTDWFQNVRAANGCVLRWRGSEYVLGEPEIVEGPQARRAFHPLERAVLRLGGVRFVHLRQLAEQVVPPTSRTAAGRTRRRAAPDQPHASRGPVR